MSVSLFDLSVPTFLQTVRAIGGCLDKANAHCSEIGADPDDFVTARLVEGMAPFHFQIECVARHSIWALETVKSGVFSAPALIGEMPFFDLRAMIEEAEASLGALAPDQVNAWSGKDLDLQIGPRKLSFTSETFLLSFALPNLFFMRSPPTTFFGREAYRSTSAILKAGCLSGRTSTDEWWPSNRCRIASEIAAGA